MIEFDCPHCENHFRVAETLAGRHGWCRLCKGFVVVPTARSRHRWEDLPAEQRVVRLEKILRSTTELYNTQHEQLLTLRRALTEYADDVARARGATQELEQVAPRLEQAERDISRLSHELAQAAESKGVAQAHAERADRDAASAREAQARAEAERDTLATETTRLQELLHALESAAAEAGALQTECDTLKRRLSERDADLQRAHEDMAGGGTGGLMTELEDARAAREEALARKAEAESEARQLEKSLAAATADAAHWRAEAERLDKAGHGVAEMQAKWDEAQALIRQLHPGIAAAHEALGRAEAEGAEAKNRAARLEEQVSRLTEDNEAQREVIAGLRRDLEQSRSAAKAAEGQAEAARESGQRQEHELARLREAAVKAAMLEPVTAERDAFRDRLVEADAQVMRLKEELASLSNEAVAAGAGDGIGREREALHAELIRAQQAKAEADHRAQELAAELREIHARLEQVTAERNRLVEEVTGLQEKGARFDSLWSDLASAQARLEESQQQVERLTERLAHAGPQAPYSRPGTAGRGRGYGAPVIPDNDDSQDIALVPEVVDDGGVQHSQELMASMLRFIEPREKGG